MSTEKLATAIAVLAVVLLGACGGSSTAGTHSSPASAISDPQTLAAKLNAKGVNCSGYAVKPPSGVSSGIPQGKRGQCTYSGGKVTLSVYKDPGEVDNAEGAIKAIGCPALKAFGTKHIYYARGTNYTSSATNETDNAAVAKALGIPPTTVDC